MFKFKVNLSKVFNCKPKTINPNKTIAAFKKHHRKVSKIRLDKAEKNIEKFRKANYKILVTDQNGNPVKNAPVHAELRDHDFIFGIAASVKGLWDGSWNNQEMYRNIVSSGSFNMVTIENAPKWKFYEKFKHYIAPTLEWCIENHLPVRGHVLLWPAFKRIPKNLHHLKDKPEELRKVIKEHIIEFLKIGKGYIAQWDALNELYSNHEFMDILGDKIVAEWIKIAKKVNPACEYYINDWGILTGSTDKHRANYHKWIKLLNKYNAPLSGIAFQSHFDEPTFPSIIYDRIKEYTKYKQKLLVSEFDFNTKNQGLQADYTEKFMTLIFGHPRMTGLITWSLWAGKAWKPDAAFYTKDWTKKQNAKRWDKLVKGKWHTDVNLVTDNKGKASFRGFKGIYSINVTGGGRSKDETVNFDKDKKIKISI